MYLCLTSCCDAAMVGIDPMTKHEAIAHDDKPTHIPCVLRFVAASAAASIQQRMRFAATPSSVTCEPRSGRRMLIGFRAPKESKSRFVEEIAACIGAASQHMPVKQDRLPRAGADDERLDERRSDVIACHSCAHLFFPIVFSTNERLDDGVKRNNTPKLQKCFSSSQHRP